MRDRALFDLAIDSTHTEASDWERQLSGNLEASLGGHNGVETCRSPTRPITVIQDRRAISESRHRLDQLLEETTSTGSFWAQVRYTHP